MVSPIKFLKLLPSAKGLKNWWAQLVIIIVSLAAIPFAGYLCIPVGFVLYILLSLVHKYPEESGIQQEVTN